VKFRPLLPSLPSGPVACRLCAATLASDGRPNPRPSAAGQLQASCNARNEAEQQEMARAALLPFSLYFQAFARTAPLPVVTT